MIWCLLFMGLFLYLISYYYMSPNLKKKIYIFFLLIMCIIVGTRDVLSFGTDESVYHTMYQMTPKINNLIAVYSNKDNLISSYEIGYITFLSLCKTIGLNYYGLILLEAIIVYFAIYVGFKRYINNFALFLMIIMYKIFTYYTMVAMRQCMAMAIFFFAIHYIEDRKWIKYYFLTALAVTMHNGALYLMFVYPLIFVPLNKKRYIIINLVMACTLIFRLLQVDVFGAFSILLKNLSFINQNKLDGVASGEVAISWLHTIEYYFIVLIVWYKYDDFINEKHAKFIVKLSLAMTPIYTLFSQYVMFTRIKDYFTLLFAILIVYSVKQFSPKVRQITIFIVGAWFAYGFFRHILAFDNGVFFRDYMSNFVNILSGKESLIG